MCISLVYYSKENIITNSSPNRSILDKSNNLPLIYSEVPNLSTSTPHPFLQALAAVTASAVAPITLSKVPLYS